LWSLGLNELDDFLENNINNLDPLQVEGFQNLLTGLDEFFEEESVTSLTDDNRMEMFSSASLESTDIIRATSNFHGSPMFSNVIINGSNSEEEINWYGLVSIDIFISYSINTNLTIKAINAG
jgi:hypothetical protein